MYELNYYLPFVSDNIIYSCDMIRLKFYLDKNHTLNLNEFEYYLIVHFGFDSQYYHSMSASSYRYLYNFKRADCAITVGLYHNTCEKNTGYHGNFIEFNPNKVDMSAIKYLFDFFYNNTDIYANTKHSTIFDLIRWDLAVDVPIDKHYVRLLKTGKRKYTRIEDKGSVTEYLGKHNTNGFVKVYDKTKESNLYYDLTRIEITNDSLIPVLPDVHILQHQTSLDFDFELNSTDKVLVELIKRQDEEADYWLRQLGRNKMNKLKPYVFEQKDMFKFDKTAIFHVTEVVENICNMQIEYAGGDYSAYHIESVKQRSKACKQSDISIETDNQNWQPINEEEWKKHELDYFNNYYRGFSGESDNNV